MYNLKGCLDDVRSDTQPTKLQFQAICDKGKVYEQLFDKMDWFYSTPTYLFKPIDITLKSGR